MFFEFFIITCNKEWRHIYHGWNFYGKQFFIQNVSIGTLFQIELFRVYLYNCEEYLIDTVLYTLIDTVLKQNSE